MNDWPRFGTRVDTLWGLIGDDPEAIEASLLQAYPHRDPIGEFLHGRLTARRLRVMIEHLPPDSPWLRGKRAGWSDIEWLLWNVEARVREAITQQANMWRREGTSPAEPTYLPTPVIDSTGADDGDLDESAAERAELVALMHR